ncbi:hypothetical protein [Streptomyces sp. NPDC059491]|uniref:hypothetical protein n=1 Tax=Streptomyces sp. NPDC059491 TaxID=3346850 RepID=UPI0036BB7B31
MKWSAYDTHTVHRALPRPLTAATALAALCLAATGCTAGGTRPTAPPSSAPAPHSAPADRAKTEAAQGDSAKKALETISPDDPDFVASGLERVHDGVHARNPLRKGRAYTVSVACVGTGDVQVVLADRTPRPVPCDGISTDRRIDSAPAELPLDITPAPGATGMVAWQITVAP